MGGKAMPDDQSVRGATGRRTWIGVLVVLAVLGAGYSLARLTGLLGNAIEVRADWEPFKESRYNLAREWSELRNLKPDKSVARYGAADFHVFLPSRPSAVGETWELDGNGLLPFLKQFHPGATLQLHHGAGSAPGAFACLRAQSDRYDDIVFRAHAEFALSGGRSFYTPAQFAGQVLFDRTAGRVVFFHLYLPPRYTNVDVNRFLPVAFVDGHTEANVGAIDVGYSPRMELIGGNKQLPESITWQDAITYAEADQHLAMRFYEFLKIHWWPWDEAVAESKRTGKPLHTLVLLGTLDDESC
jgi:hypothetical protein